MTIIYIIAGVILVGLLFRFIQNKKNSNSPYHKIQQKLKDDLLQANFSGDWRKFQTINLQLIWLKTIQEVESRDAIGNKNDTDKTSLLAKLTVFKRAGKNHIILIPIQGFAFPFASKAEHWNIVFPASRM